jgi:hypothetical protein
MPRARCRKRGVPGPVLSVAEYEGPLNRRQILAVTSGTSIAFNMCLWTVAGVAVGHPRLDGR